MRSTIFTALLAFASACGDNHVTKEDAGVVVDAAPVDASCFTDPHTNEEIINACTSAQKIYKTPVLPLRNADGSLPALPPH
jgi:hypothetical protein